METAGLSDIKKAAAQLSQKELIDLVLRLSKYKKETKELAGYLLFHADNEAEYIDLVKEEMDALFADVNRSHSYLAKKTVRKILRLCNKYIRFSGIKTTEVEILIHFCKKMRMLPSSIRSTTVMENIYTRQLIKISKAMKSLHEDIQFDYKADVDAIMHY